MSRFFFKPKEPLTDIWQAAEDGDLEQVKKLITLGVDVNSKDANVRNDDIMISLTVFCVSPPWSECLTLLVLFHRFVCVRKRLHCTLQQDIEIIV